MRHYRVDKMAELAVTCLPLEGADGGFDIASYAQKHFGMFSGREGQITLRCRNSLVGVVLDRFGRDAILVPDGEEHFTVTVPAVVSPQFLGWVFGLGDGVQILRPDWAAEELKRQLAAVAALYFVDSTAFEGLLPSVMSALSLFERFYTFVNGVFDLTAVFYYLTVAALFLFLSVQSLEKRRYN